MQHLSYTSRSSIFRFGIGMLVLFFFCAPVHANYIPFQSTSNRPVISQPISNSINGSSNSNIVGEYKPYHPNVYVPFGDETPSSGNPLNNNGSGGSGDPNDDVGIPGWADTPSEPLPIGDTAPLFLFAAAMIAIIFIKQRRQQLQSTTQSINTSNNNDNNDTMHTTRHISSNRLQKLFLLLAFVCFVGQVSGQTFYVRQLFKKAESTSNRPTNFPEGYDKDNYTSSKNNLYKNAQQATYINGAFYTSDPVSLGSGKIVKITSEGTVSEFATVANLRMGICRDDAGNLIVNTSESNTHPLTLTVYPAGTNGPTTSGKKTITFGTDDNNRVANQSNFISAKGDVLNGTGYVYFYPANRAFVQIVTIKNGAYYSITKHTNLSATAGGSGGYVIPISGTSHYIYNERSVQTSDDAHRGYYLYQSGNKGVLLTNKNYSQTAPDRNATYGGAYFTVADHNMFVYGSGSNYYGGWSMRDLSNNETVIHTESALGSGGSSYANPSCGAFFTCESVNKYIVNLYEYCQGNGIAGWEIRGSANKQVRIQTHDGNATGATATANWPDNANGGTISFAYYKNASNASSTTTTNITAGGYQYFKDVNPDKNITLTATPNSEYTFIGWWNNGATYTANPWTHVAENSNQSITARFAKLKQQTINIHTYDTESNTYIANATGGTVAIEYNNALSASNTATLTASSGSYKALINSTVTLTATPKSGYVFIGWYKGNEHMDWATTNECSFKADDAYNITARFTKLVSQTFKVQTYESTAYADGGNGGTMTVNYNDGTTATVTNSTSISNLYQGYNVTLTANAKTGYKFMGWFNNDFTTEYSKGSNTYTYRGEGTRTIHARFRKTYNQTVNISTYNPATGQYVSGGDGGVVTSVTYDDGNAQSLSDVTNSTFTPLVNTTVTVVANAKPGYQFDGWYNGETLLSKDIEYTYTVNAAKTITARFIKNDVQLVVSVMNYNTDYAEFVEYPHDNNTVTIAYGGNNTTVTSSTSAVVNYGSQVTLTASPDPHQTEGYDFIGWYQNNQRISTNPTYTFTLTDHSAISAHFAPKQCHKVIVKASVGGIYTVKYAREDWFNTEGMYYTATSQYEKDVEIHVPYDAKIAVLNPQPIIGYSYLGYKVTKGIKDNDTYTIDVSKYNKNDPPMVAANLVRTDEQVIYLDISNKDKADSKWNEKTQFGCNLRTSFAIENNCTPRTATFEQVTNTLYKLTIQANVFESITIVDAINNNLVTVSSLPQAIPATRYNCFKLNSYQSSTGEWVDAWTTLDTENGDYRLIYREQTVVDKNTIRVDYEFNEGDRIKKRTTEGTDIVSLHIYNKVSNDGVNGINNPEVILQQWSDNEDAWVDVERYMVFGPLRSNDASVIKMPNRKNTSAKIVVDKGIDNIMTDKTDNGCGVWNFVIEQDGTTARLLVDETRRYEGNYYIRTTNADGQYNNFTHPNNVMTYSEYAKKNSDFSHYFVRYVDIYEDGTKTAEAGKHPVVKFTIANDHAMFLCKEFLIDNNRFTDDEYGNDIFVLDKDGAPNLPVDATVRFGWDIVTNRLTRAYIADTEFKNNEYLIVEGDKIGDVSGEKAYFDEIGDHFYQIDLSAQVPSDIKVKAKMNGNYQYFMGSENATDQLIGGQANGSYPLRLLYDFKNDRFITICELAGTINGNINLETSVMIMREHNDAPKQLTFANNDASITATPNVPNTGQDQYTKPAYAVMTFLEDKLMDNNVSKYEKMFYWISFPFDVKISDVFGLGEYGKYWIMEEYDGAQRAQNGLAQTNWKYITKKSHVLKQNVGYVLCLNYNQILQDQLFTSHGAGEFGHSKLSLYFPSNSVISPAMLKGGQTVTRTLEQMENNATAWNHHNWHLIGVPSFATPGFDSKQDDIPFLYQYWHPGDAYAAVTPNDVTFHAMHSFMVQYYGDITWTSVVNTGGNVSGGKSLAAKTDEEADEKIMLRLELQQAGITIDKTYVQLRNDKGTKGFDMSLDLTKIINAGANIYSIVDNHEMAGNAIPKEETVLPIGVVITAAGDYTFAMPQGTEGMVVELIDYEQSTCTNLLVGDYTVNMPAGTNNTRFALRLVPEKVATSVDNIGNEADGDKVRKLFIDGVLYLVKDGAVYDAQGHAIR